jgi:hypothetical protein
MPQPVARVGDTGVGVCYAHDTPTDFVVTFTTGDPLMKADGMAVCTVGTIGTTSCGHHTIALVGSTLCKGTNGEGLHRVGDTGVVIEDNSGVYVVTNGSGITKAD